MTSIKAIITDDELLFKEGVKMILTQNDIEVIDTASNGLELLEKLAAGPMPDIVLLDLSMPVMDGIDTLLEIKKRDYPCKVIILTSHYNDNLIIQLLDEGASGFLAKNEAPNEVITTIQNVYNNEFHFNNHILQLIRNRRLLAKNKEANQALSERETEILKLICEQYTNQEIADKIFLSKRTVEGHRNRILQKIGAKNTVGMVIYAIENNLHSVSLARFGD